MHNPNRFFSVIVLLVIFGLIGCATNKPGASSNADDNYGGTSEVHVDNPSITLADYLRRVSGVQVYGNGSSARVIIRGTETLGGGSGATVSSSPLFVFNGVKIGRNFSRISNLVNMNEVTHIRVLKGIEASSSYGLVGGNGVVEILTN
jgi:outer membrane receptor for ferrienterochelin and colicin